MAEHEVETKQLVFGSPLRYAAGVERISRHRVKLTVMAGPDKGKTCEIEAARVTIGTAPTNDLGLTDDTVSRHHCEIVVRDNRYVLRDLQSTNGTYIDKVRVFEAVIEPSMHLFLGDSEICFESSHDWVSVGHSGSDHFGKLYGTSSCMKGVFGLLENVSPLPLTCLVIGETGTGKELAARAIHDASTRAKEPFVVVDCSVMNSNMIEAELFGHERGSFTGAVASRPGSFERANGGTVFLDEVGELPLELQPKLLRVVERREVSRIGAGKVLDLDVRIVAATHRDLGEMVRANRFREDLFYRLAEVLVYLPALRDHLEDIPVLAMKLLEQTEGNVNRIAPDALAYLQQQPWPGNVRELRNLVRRAAAFAKGNVIQRDLLVSLDTARLRKPQQPSKPETGAAFTIPEHLPLRNARNALDREYLSRLLRHHGTDYDAAAEHAGLHKKSLMRLLRQHRLADDGGRAPRP